MMKNLLLNLKALAVATFLLATLAASADVTIWVYYDSESGSVYPNGIGIAKLCVDGQSDILLTNKVTVDGRTWYWHTYKGITNGLLCFKNADNSNESPKLKFKEGDNFYYYTGSRYGINITGVKENAYYYIFERPHKWTDYNPEWFPRAYIYNDAVNPNVNNATWPGVTMTFIGGKKVDSFGSNDGTGSGVNDDNFTVWAATCDFQPNGIIFVRGKYNGSSWDNWNQFEHKNPMNYGYYKFNTNDNYFYDGNGNVGGLADPENHYVNMTWPTMVTATLAQIEANPSNYTNKVVTISDALTVGGLVGSTIYAHDAVNVAEAAPSGAIDYNNSVLHFDNSVQNNWIAINGVSNADENYTLTGVTGVLSDVDNFSFDASDYTVNEQAGSPVLNTYIPCNFTGTQTTNGKTYFFAKPQVMEYANIYAAVYNGGTSFLVPEKQVVNGTQINGAELQGGFNVASVSGYNLIQGTMYKFPAVIKKTANGGQAPRRVAGTNGNYSVEIAGNPQAEGIATAVTDVRNAGKVAGVKYVNVAGQVSNTPWQGVNIVVTTMTDGTTRTAKVVR